MGQKGNRQMDEKTIRQKHKRETKTKARHKKWNQQMDDKKIRPKRVTKRKP